MRKPKTGKDIWQEGGKTGADLLAEWLGHIPHGHTFSEQQVAGLSPVPSCYGWATTLTFGKDDAVPRICFLIESYHSWLDLQHWMQNAVHTHLMGTISTSPAPTLDPRCFTFVAFLWPSHRLQTSFLFTLIHKYSLRLDCSSLFFGSTWSCTGTVPDLSHYRSLLELWRVRSLLFKLLKES